MDYEKRLKSRGYRSTRQRRAILEVLEENAGLPMSPDDIHALAEKRNPGIGLTTVYRTLVLFRGLGIVMPVHLHDDSQHYEISSGEHHHHLVCESCGSIQILDACVIDKLEDEIRDRSDFLVKSHCLSLFGLCPECQRVNRSPG